MTSLSQSDLEATLGFLREAEAVTGPDPFPSELLDVFRRLVPCEYVSYNEIDSVEMRFLFHSGCSQELQAAEAIEMTPDEEGRIFWRLKYQHPLCAYQARTGDFSAHKFSDFVTWRSLHRLEIYTELFRPWGIEHEFAIGLPSTPGHTKCFQFDSSRRDFGERDRLVLDLVRPHLTALYAAARARRCAAALTLGEQGRGGVVVLEPSGRIDFADASAVEMLSRYMGGRFDDRLPEPIESWLRRQTRRLNGNGSLPPPGETLTLDRDGHRLSISRAGNALLLQEDIGSLTVREREIVEQLAQGCSNAEIAANLMIAPTTVRKHLENIYAKLGVRNRTAALARVRGLRGR